ncbi:hypothetical protein NDU88_000288 [Pleurodeles waltl]|uniref:Myb/SANT-like DNA-binding domain-containing protein n=1 Tax=Pleurodeles waltl TaxID=8319 RepID=A0AAV7VW64_PLEWA|nr:hypothetical protein NDU88_000288 [Pleurodeles waltl]
MEGTPRRRKLKFSERELEVLTEECCQHHDELFGRAALTVPEATKKKLWQDIQEKINSLGVSHRTIEDIKKRWYDLRSRTKERVAERLREMRGTGGGPSSVPPPTPLEERVEETLEKEAVCGFGDLDTSEPSTSTGLQQDTPNTPTTQAQEETPGPASTPTCTVSSIPALVTPAATITPEAAPATGREDTGGSTGQPPLRRRRRARPSGSGILPPTSSEAHLLRGQRLQNRILGRISGVLHRFVSHNHASMQHLNRRMDMMCQNTGDIALAIRELAGGLLGQAEAGRRRDRQTMQRLDRMATSIGRLAINTTGLSRRTLGLQIEMGHFAGDVARGLGRLTHIIELMETREMSRATGETPQDSEEGSTVSSVSATDSRVLRSGRHSTTDAAGTSQAGRRGRRT